MKKRTCHSCGAPLPVAHPGETVSCTHCGTAFDVPFPSATAATSAATRVVFAVLAGGVLLVTSVAVALIASSGPRTPVVVLPPGLAKPEAPDAGLPVSRVGELTHVFGWTALDAPGMQGSWDDFQVFANLGWMNGIATTWAADARLTWLSIDGVAPDGTVDLSARDDWSLDVRYASPALRSSARAALEVSEEPIKSEFRLDVEAGVVKALVDVAHGGNVEEEVPPPPELGCTLPELMEAAFAAGMAKRPRYDLRMTWSPPRRSAPGAWRWVFTSGNPHDRFDSIRLDAASCKP